jgi:hypothetical protein
MTRPGEELPHELELELGRAYDHRRKPRVRFRKGGGHLFITLGQRMTRRAAFRGARELRDRHGEKRQQVVWKVSAHVYRFGVRRELPDGKGAAPAGEVP